MFRIVFSLHKSTRQFSCRHQSKAQFTLRKRHLGKQFQKLIPIIIFHVSRFTQLTTLSLPLPSEPEPGWIEAKRGEQENSYDNRVHYFERHQFQFRFHQLQVKLWVFPTKFLRTIICLLVIRWTVQPQYRRQRNNFGNARVSHQRTMERTNTPTANKRCRAKEVYE